MSEQKRADIVQKQRRKKRVKTLKRAIVICLIAAILFPTILCFILFAKVHRLEQQVEVLEAKREERRTVQGGQLTAALSGKNTGDEASDLPASLMLSDDAATQEAVVQQDGLYEGAGASGGNRASGQETAEASETVKVYLTFDDGPSRNTGAILDILQKYQVRATFFVVGKSEEYTPLYQRIVNEGHTIGMHSYSHKYRELYESLDSFREDLYSLQDLIYERTGVRSTIYRFPGGSSNTVSQVDMKELISFLDEENITYYDWNVSSLDASGRKLSVDEIVENVTGDIQSYRTAMVLMHDANDKTTTVEALPIIIERLQAMERVELLPITENTVKVQHVQQ